ncbi:DJ-1/PfpI family protein [Acinetobacter sp. EC115]|nr:DJ-1/PfpI family protein [Acinetobacter rathckeae]
MHMQKISIGFLLFPGVTQLDLTGPYEVFSRSPNTAIYLIWKDKRPVMSEKGLEINPNTTFDACPDLDIICIPGGPGQIELMDDEDTLNFIKTKSLTAKLITSVCTGSLLLGAAGLLVGYKATSHWASIDQLKLFGAIPITERIVTDRNRITGAGVTSGIDFALKVVSDTFGEEVARRIQLHMEYDPHPPFDSGSPCLASSTTITHVREYIAPLIEKRLEATKRAASKLNLGI